MSDTRFLADSMLGRLAKWLRIMGYNTYYQPRYLPGELEGLAKGDRVLLTRKKRLSLLVPTAILLGSERIGEQIKELKARGLLSSRPIPFSRCIRCNTLLISVDHDTLSERVPEYVIHKSGNSVRQCPSCGRCYWPGSHRKRMERQLHLWGVQI